MLRITIIFAVTGGNAGGPCYDELWHCEDVRRYEMIGRHIGRLCLMVDRFAIDARYGKVYLTIEGQWSDKTFGAHLT